jgi:hypothetical protein
VTVPGSRFDEALRLHQFAPRASRVARRWDRCAQELRTNEALDDAERLLCMAVKGAGRGAPVRHVFANALNRAVGDARAGRGRHNARGRDVYAAHGSVRI